jgi:hypothetical protein
VTGWASLLLRITESAAQYNCEGGHTRRREQGGQKGRIEARPGGTGRAQEQGVGKCLIQGRLFGPQVTQIPNPLGGSEQSISFSARPATAKRLLAPRRSLVTSAPRSKIQTQPSRISVLVHSDN